MLIQLLGSLVVLASAGLLLRGVVVGRRSRGALSSRRADRLALWIALWLALIPPVLLLIVPTDSGLTRTEAAGGDSASTTVLRVRLLDAVGLWELLLLCLPMVLVGAGLAARSSMERRWVILTAAALLTLFVVLGALSIGLWFVPSAAALWMAGLLAPREPRAA